MNMNIVNKRKYGVKKFNSAKRNKPVFDKKDSKTTIECNEIENCKSQYECSTYWEKFEDYPLSSKTKKALLEYQYNTATEIQRECIGRALCGNDILGAAKTGSGKTLAFLIPVLESLWRNKWSPMDGLGALIISPTRELAYQTFEVLKKIGKYHEFSAGLVIGGKKIQEETDRINRTNIVICTPGRLLQHMDETFAFNCDNLMIFVLDEADKILEMGFSKTVNSIIENLPECRQTLMFSATQTKSVKNLARLSLKTPIFISVHEHSEYSTPENLVQSYIICELEEKLTILWSFIKSNLKKKTIVFLSSCKQVRFIFEAFRKLRPGVTVLSLHGAMQQHKRIAIYDEFSKKSFCVLFSTDLAARGLDFPSVDWVIQADCPEDINTYIHRVGRTARLNNDGQAVLFLTPSESTILEEFNNKRIPIEEVRVNSKRMKSISGKLEAFCAENVEFKEFAQRAFTSYIRSIYLMKNKNIFNVNNIKFEELSKSFGLMITPRIRFLEKLEKQSSSSTKTCSKITSVPFKIDDNLLENQDIFTIKKSNDKSDTESSDLENNVSSKKRKKVTKFSIAKKLMKKNIKSNKKVEFDEDGQPIINEYHERTNALMDEDIGGINISEAAEILKQEDLVDKKLYNQRIREEKIEKKEKERKKRLELSKKNVNKSDKYNISINTSEDEYETDLDVEETDNEDHFDLNSEKNSIDSKNDFDLPDSCEENHFDLNDNESLALKLINA